MPRTVYVQELGRAFSFADGTSDEAVSAFFQKNFPTPKEAPLPDVAAPTPPGEDIGALESGFYGYLGRLGTAGGSISQAAGLDDLSKYLFEQAKRNEEYAAKYKPEVADISEVEGAGDLASFAGSTIAQSAPDTLTGIGGAYAGAAAGAALGSVFPVVGTAAGGILGGVIGGAIAALPSFIGGNLQRQAIEKGIPIEETDLTSASTGAIVQSPLDAAFDVLIARKLPGGSAALDIARKGFLREVAKTAGRGAVTEALTEPAQQAIELAQANPEKLLEFGPDVQFEILNSAAAGALSGGVIGGAAGGFESTVTRRLAERPYRQLEEDLGKESALNAQAQRQGEISRAAEELRRLNLNGDVEVVEDEFDGISRFTIQTPGGNTVGTFLDLAEAEETINLYKQRTDAKVTIRKPTELPSVFPVKINGKEYQTTNDIIADRDSIVSKKEGLAAYMSRPDVIKREAARQNVSEDLVKKATAEEVADLDKQIVKLNEFVAVAKPTPAADLGEGDVRSLAARRAAPEAVIPEEITPEAATAEIAAPEAPIGAAEAVSAEAPITEAPAIVEAPEPSVGPVEATENRTLAGPLKEAPTPRRTLSQAEAEGPILRDYNQATIDRYAGIYTALKSRLAGKVPKNAEIKLEELISTPASLLVKGQARVEKTPNGIKSIVDLSTGILRPDMTVEDAVNELVGTLDHEIIHVLRDQGLIRPSEWNVLSKAATSTKVPGRAYTYLDKAQTVYTPNGQPISPIYANPDAVIEEAVAEMYKDWVKNQKAPVQVRGLFNRITEFLRNIFRALKSSKHQDVFKAIDAGEVGAREGVGRETAEGARFSAAPALNSEEFRKWFGGSKGVNPDGTPKVFYHGTSKDQIYTKFKTGPRGIFFTDDPASASEYAIENDSMDLKPGPGWSFTKVNTASRVIPVYLSYKNPYTPTEDDMQKLNRSADYRKGQRELFERVRRVDPTIDAINFAQGVVVVFDPAQAKSTFNQFEKGAATNPRFSAAPLPPYIEAKNRTLFVPEEKRSFVKDMFDFFSGPPASGRTLNTIYGQIDVKSKTRLAVSARTAIVDMDAAFEFLEKTANQKDTGNFQRREATQSTIVALGMARRSSQLTAATVTQGAPIISFSRPGDIQSATVSMRNDADKLIDIFKVMLEPGPVDSVTGERKDKRTVFKMYATAKRAIGLKAAGLPVPSELDDTYINTTIPFVQQNYPEIVEAYEKYQRFNKKLITAARDAGRITDAELAKFTQQMDYYGFYREVYEEQLVPGMPSKLAGDIKIREYKGSQRGELIEDPMLVILTNVNFWMGAITRNIATNKAFKLAKDMGEARLLGTSEKPDLSQGESEQVMFFRENGAQKRFAVKDPLLVTSLGADDGADMGAAMRLIGLPTTALRESVTRDPVFMVRNLLRDTLSSWITSGEDITPFIGTVNGFRKALNNSSSYQALIGRGVVGSHDLAMRSPAEMAAIIRRRALPKGIMDVTSIDGMQGLIMSAWDRLGVWSEASDAATRIAVYESAIKQGMSEEEAAFRAIEIMNFSRRGSSSFLQILTRLVPFLNARIQGMDVLYQAGKAGVMTATGYQLGERDANLGKKFLYRGAILAALSVALEMMLDGDEDYEEIPDYVKNGNLLLPLKWLGIEGGYFAAVPKPFESGLLFSTIPQELYKATTGETSGREMANFFWSEFVSTFGINPIPQILLPGLEAGVNYDFYTGLPLISAGKERLTPELQYDSRTSTVAMMLSGVPISYNFTTGKFEGVSPIIIDQLISGYGGPMGTYIMQGVGVAMENLGAGPERLPKDITQLPGIKSFLLDAESRSPKSVAQAYELFRVVDGVSRSFSRLRQTGDVEATMDYLEENRNVLAYKKHIYRLFDGLNKLSARERQIERDETMTRDEKFEAMKQLREVRARLTSNIGEINKALGR